MQSGQIIRKGRSWLLRYWIAESVDGKKTWKRKCRKIADYCDKYRTEKSLKPLIDEILAPERAKANDPAAPGVLTLSDFIRNKYMPYVRDKKKSSTADGYDDIFRLHVEPNVGNTALEDFGAPEAQQLTDKLVKKGFTTRTCLHIKSFLSGAVSYAIRTEAMAGPHPLAGRGLVCSLHSQGYHFRK